MICIIWYPEAAFSTCSQSLCRRYLSEEKRSNDLRQAQNAHACGGVAEWSKAAVLKTVEPRGSVGSNPTASASKIPDRQNAAHAAHAASIDKLRSRSANAVPISKCGPDQQNAVPISKMRPSSQNRPFWRLFLGRRPQTFLARASNWEEHRKMTATGHSQWEEARIIRDSPQTAMQPAPQPASRRHQTRCGVTYCA